MSELLKIAIDGPSGAGKSTIAKLVAQKLHIEYVDTGAMYRALGLKALRDNIDMGNLSQVAELLKTTRVDIVNGRIILDGEDVTDFIRTNQVSKAASDISAIKIVREKMVKMQQDMGKSKSVIMDGRDIGTVVLKDSHNKFYLTAEDSVRAKRRYDELKAKGCETTFEDVLEQIRQRDYNDSNREVTPLRKAEDAIEIDSSNMTIEQVVNYICDHII